MKLFIFATILMSALVAPVVYSGKKTALIKGCSCRINNAIYINGLCLRSLICKKSPKLPLMNDRKIGNTILVYNQRVYRAYPVVAKHSNHCPVAGTFYNRKFNMCVRMLKCSEKVFGVPNGSISNKYYIFKNKLYQSYPAHCV